MNELRDLIYLNAKNKGFWDNERNIAEALMLVVTELAEAVEVHRREGYVHTLSTEIKEQFDEMNDQEFVEYFVLVAKDQFADEMADSIIRILDLCGGLNIDIDWHIRAKIRYNHTRARLHGKKY
jgi:NTP pyrophosphatase (non-canonical NTP hydrolase)